MILLRLNPPNNRSVIWVHAHAERYTCTHTQLHTLLHTGIHMYSYTLMYMYTHIKALRYLTSGFTREKTFKAINKSRILLQILSGS